jgi:uncharacterized protein involved in exopolysaccharide biosynthesis
MGTNVPEMGVEDDGVELLDLLLPLVEHWKLLALGPLAVGVVSLALTFAIPETFTSRTVLLPPQPQQGIAASALTQLGALGGLAALGGTAIKNPADQYVALLESTTVADRLIDEFKLMQVYDVEYRFQARDELADNVKVTLGRKDGLITIQVDDRSPLRAADIANRHVDELRRLTSQLALTEAQQRRVFFEAELGKTREQLSKAQQALQSSGFSQGALRTDARVSAEGYARLRAEIAAAEVRLQALRRSLADDTPEVQQTLTTLGALRAQLAKLEDATDLAGAPDYVSKFREFKYQETLFELFARQYELARVDESREGALIQVVDVANPAEYKSRPKRLLIAVAAGLAALLLLVAFVLGRDSLERASERPGSAAKLARLRALVGRH